MADQCHCPVRTGCVIPLLVTATVTLCGLPSTWAAAWARGGTLCARSRPTLQPVFELASRAVPESDGQERFPTCQKGGLNASSVAFFFSFAATLIFGNNRLLDVFVFLAYLREEETPM